MAIFTNFATLTFNGGSTNSNTVTGEILETIAATKTAVTDNYTAGDTVTYVVSITNSGPNTVTDLSVTDDLGGYEVDGETVYPLSFTDDSLLYFVNGVPQDTPTVTAGPPLVVSGIDVPAGGNVMLIYEAAVTAFAPPAAGATITNTATVNSTLFTPVTASETITAAADAQLTISKALSPTVVTENGEITYTFVIENSGNTDAVATDDLVMTDTFDPILSDITVTYNGAPWVEGTHYTYNEETGVFRTVEGAITVPAATYAQNTDGTWAVTPGTATLVVTGTV